jgi:hypothetical protein
MSAAAAQLGVRPVGGRSKLQLTNGWTGAIIADGIAAGQTENPPNHYAVRQALLQKTYARAQIRR